MRAPVAYSLGAMTTAVVYAASKVLGQVLFHRSVMYPRKES